MVHAFVMVKTGPGQSEAMVEAARGVDAIAEAHIVAGDYDLVVEIETDEVYEVLHTASTELQGLDGIENTKTYISLD
ncbi:Lrp/AsnC family transcriptional regulator [Halalkalicoccus subterraneus]|uniref:Lrp/AsnC family transcriptional regulator n=1 Tax=Halalkalicoccus subterraneus TaxID=2675002 RepID=UPI000EFC55E2|nr:Lrp/AsnC ligand binding domain-containing protein [Halalkalicoccus subterraneus]